MNDIMHDRNAKAANQKRKAFMSSSLNGLDLSKLSPLLGQLCAIKILGKKKAKGMYVGIGKLAIDGQKLTVWFECAALLKESRNFWPPWPSRKRGVTMKVKSTGDSYTIHFRPIGFNLTPEDWQVIATDNGTILLSFQEKEIKEIDASLDFHTKGRT
jgi:hypothetical protein